MPRLDYQLQLRLLAGLRDGDLAEVQSALAAGANPNATTGDKRGRDWTLPVVEAATRHDPIFTQTLLAAGGDPLLADGEGSTALIKAASYGNAEVVDLLVPISDLGAFDREGNTALMAAIDSLQAKKWLPQSSLLSPGAEAGGPQGTAAHFAARRPMIVGVSLFARIAALCDPWALDEQGHTALRVLCDTQYTGQEHRAAALLPAMQATSTPAVFLRMLTFHAGLVEGSGFREMTHFFAEPLSALWERADLDGSAAQTPASAKPPRI